MNDMPGDWRKAALSRDPSRREGGYGFLKRCLAEHFNTTMPVILNVGQSYFVYNYGAGQTNFLEGLTVRERGADFEDCLPALAQCAETYDIMRGAAEIFAESPGLQARLMAYRP